MVIAKARRVLLPAIMLIVCPLVAAPARAEPANEFDDLRLIFSEKCGARDYPTLQAQVKCTDDTYQRASPAGPELRLFDTLAAKVQREMQSRGMGEYEARQDLQNLLSQAQRRLNAGLPVDPAALAHAPYESLAERSAADGQQLQWTAHQRYVLDELRGCLSDNSLLAMQVTCAHGTYLSESADFVEPFDTLARQVLDEVHSKRLSEAAARRQLLAAFPDPQQAAELVAADMTRQRQQQAEEQRRAQEVLNSRIYGPNDEGQLVDRAAQRRTFAETALQALQQAGRAMQEAPLMPFKQKCTAFGFTEGTPEFAQCVQREYNAAQPARPIVCTATPMFLTCEQ